jgi:hypothetical protein
MNSKNLLVVSVCAAALAGCGAGLDTGAPVAGHVAHAASLDRVAAVRRVEAGAAVEVDACEVRHRRSTSDASGRREGFTMATVQCAWSAPSAKAGRPASRATPRAEIAEPTLAAH